MDKNYSNNDFPAVPVDVIDDNVKRWMIVVMCLHNYISPNLRTYVNDELRKQYKSLVKSHNIDKQTYRVHHYSLPLSKVKLNYKTINYNKATFKGNKKKYNYNVKSAVDLSRLYLQPHLADYTKFDSKCDTSALLGLITIIEQFPQNVRKDAEEIRDSVRNEAAHPDFEKWDSAKYADSFVLLRDLVTHLSLDPVVTNTVIGKLNIWEGNGISYLSGTPLGLELYRYSHDMWKKENMANDKKIRDLERRFEALKDELNLQRVFQTVPAIFMNVAKCEDDVDKETENAKTCSENTKKTIVVTERLEYEYKDFPRADRLRTIFQKSLDKLGRETCIPNELQDVIENRPQAIFCYKQGTAVVDYSHFSVTKLGSSVKTKESIWVQHPLTTVCILDGTLKGKLTKPDVSVLKALLDLPSNYITNTLFFVRSFSYDKEHVNLKMSLKLSDEIISVLNMTSEVNTIYGRLYPYDHPDIPLRISICFEKHMLDRISNETDRTLNDIETSEEFLNSSKMNDCKTTLSAKNGPFGISNRKFMFNDVVGKYQNDLEEFVFRDFEKKLRLELQEKLIPNVPTHCWADLSRRTNSNFIKNYRGRVLNSKFYAYLRRNCVEFNQSDIIDQEINDCKQTHLKAIISIKEFLQVNIREILDNRAPVNERDCRFKELELLSNRFDPSSKVSMMKDRYTIYLTNRKEKLLDITNCLSYCLDNMNNIKFKRLKERPIIKFMGTLKSGDRIKTGRFRHSFSTASFFLRDSKWFYLVACRHIALEGKPLYIEYENGGMTELKNVLEFEDIDMMICQIMDKSITCISGFRNDSNLFSSILLDSHVFSMDMVTLPIGLEVYKWGAGSGLTKGKFVGVAFTHSQKHIEVLIEEEQAHPFAVPGDSGSLVCFNTELKTVCAAFVLIGASVNDEKSNISAYVCLKIQDVLSSISKQLPNLELHMSGNSLHE